MQNSSLSADGFAESRKHGWNWCKRVPAVQMTMLNQADITRVWGMSHQKVCNTVRCVQMGFAGSGRTYCMVVRYG